MENCLQNEIRGFRIQSHAFRTLQHTSHVPEYDTRGTSRIPGSRRGSNLADILVYSETEEEHVKLLTKVFTCLAKYNLAMAVHKSIFHVPEVEFLGYIVNGTGISVSGETT